MDRKANKILYSFVICILTVAVVTQARFIFVTNQDGFGQNPVFDETRDSFLAAQAQNEELRQIMTALQNEFDGRIRALGDTEMELRIIELYENMTNAEIIAGLTEVSGRGLVIILNDRSRDSILPGEFQSEVIVHSYQVYGIVNELKKMGAQAISINEERVMPFTEIFCTGADIRINGNTYVPPYVIRAIGIPEDLHSGVTGSEIFREVSARRLVASISREDEVTIPKFLMPISNSINYLTEVGED